MEKASLPPNPYPSKNFYIWGLSDGVEGEGFGVGEAGDGLEEFFPCTHASCGVMGDKADAEVGEGFVDFVRFLMADKKVDDFSGFVPKAGKVFCGGVEVFVGGPGRVCCDNGKPFGDVG